MSYMNVDVTGSSRSADWVAFGDDSVYAGTLVYAFFMFKRTKIKTIERDFRELKKRFNFPLNSKLHCRELLSGQKREKSGLGHLSKEDIDAIFNTIVTIINRQKGLVRFNYAFTEKIDSVFSGPLTLDSTVDGEPSISVDSVFNEKGVLGLLAQGCFANRLDGREGPLPDQCEIFVSPDKTLVKFIGNKKNKAHYLASGFSDIEAKDGRINLVAPVIGGDYFADLYEIADVVAYICCHAIHTISGRSDEQRYVRFYDRMTWRVGNEFSASIDAL